MQLGTRRWEFCREGEFGWSNTLFPHDKRGKKGMGEKYSRSVTSRQVDKRSESETCCSDESLGDHRREQGRADVSLRSTTDMHRRVVIDALQNV